LAFSFPAQAAYDIGWDPVNFEGLMVIDFNQSFCFNPHLDPLHVCLIHVLSLDFTDMNGIPYHLVDPLGPYFWGKVFGSVGHLLGIELDLPVAPDTSPTSDHFSFGCGEGKPCILEFDYNPNTVTLYCDGQILGPTTGYTIPEPGTLALLGLALGGLAFARRRRLN
jgi:hypothetical protein